MEGYQPDSLSGITKGEAVFRIMDNLRRMPQVEAVGLGTASCPYSWVNSFNHLCRADEDTAAAVVNYYQYFSVDEGYFDVLQMKDNKGELLSHSMEGREGALIVSEDLAEKLYPGEEAVGKLVKYNPRSTKSSPILATASPIRVNDFEKSEPCYYYVYRTPAYYMENLSLWNISNVDLLVRVKGNFPAEQMDDFLGQVSDQLTAGNIYVASINSLEKMRAEFIKPQMDNFLKKIAIVAFMLVNVFFGIVGTFWLRTENRRGEVGLRMALGSTRFQLKQYLISEGLCLLLLTLPFVLAFAFNMLYLDMPDTYRLPYTWGRFLLTFVGSYLLMGVMICLGVWLPARKSASMNPADALHYE